jgi:hypothetical protein
VTDDEFVFAINRFGVDILSRKAAELVKRPATQAQVTAYHRALSLQREWNRNHRRLIAKNRMQEKASK